MRACSLKGWMKRWLWLAASNLIVVLSGCDQIVDEADIDAIHEATSNNSDDDIFIGSADEDMLLTAPTGNNLPYCSGGYWGSYAEGESIEQNDSTSGLKYEVGPNCYMWAPDSDGNGESDCGGASDDFMLSFYFGYHNENAATLSDKLRWTSTESKPRDSWYLNSLSARLYEQTKGGGADNYNVYVCLDDKWFDYFPTFRIRKY